MANIPYIPTEIHRLIAQYVHHDDLPSYRLANRQLCDICTEELFGTIVFHYSTASIDRLEELSASERLRGCVKTIFWDVNTWKIYDTHSFEDWKWYFTELTIDRIRSEYGYEREEWVSRSYKLSENQSEYAAYLEKVDDEAKARKACERLEALGRFQNLRSVHIVNGELVLSHRGLRKVADHLPVALPESCTMRRGEGINDLHSFPGIEALRPTQQYCKSSLKKLKLDKVHPAVFRESPLNFDNLRSLDLTLAMWTHHPLFWSDESQESVMVSLRMFLAGLPQLECLRIDLLSRDEYDGIELDWNRSSIHEVFGCEQTWSKLRKLSLRHFYTTPDTLVSFLDRHSSTLRDLALCDMHLRIHRSVPLDENPTSREGLDVEHTTWPKVLQELNECLSLERATASGTLGEDNVDVLGWLLDQKDGLPAAVSDYLINGGQCPLTADNAEWHPEDSE
jgi:hypothetical protein